MSVSVTVIGVVATIETITVVTGMSERETGIRKEIGIETGTGRGTGRG